MAGTYYISMLVISGTSFIFGIIPIGFTVRATKFCPFLLSLVLCLGAGILLATSIVHMLTEVQPKLHHASQLYFCIGFLILYAFDEICHFFLEGKKFDDHRDKAHGGNGVGSQYGAFGDSHLREESPLLGEKENGDGNSFGGSRENPRHCENHDQIQCHVEIGEPCLSNPVAKAGLLIALTMHSILEGISIGVQTKYSEILLILGSVTFHKVVLSFCLGLELHSHGVKAVHLVMAILVFSLGSSVGIFIGTLVTSTNGIFNVDAQMQALAAGSLLYVAAFEVLPRERFRWQHQKKYRTAGLGQLFFVILGFVCVTLVHMYLGESHDGNHISSNSTRSISYNVSESST